MGRWVGSLGDRAGGWVCGWAEGSSYDRLGWVAAESAHGALAWHQCRVVEECRSCCYREGSCTRPHAPAPGRRMQRRLLSARPASQEGCAPSAPCRRRAGFPTRRPWWRRLQVFNIETWKEQVEEARHRRQARDRYLAACRARTAAAAAAAVAEAGPAPGEGAGTPPGPPADPGCKELGFPSAGAGGGCRDGAGGMEHSVSVGAGLPPMGSPHGAQPLARKLTRIQSLQVRWAALPHTPAEYCRPGLPVACEPGAQCPTVLQGPCMATCTSQQPPYRQSRTAAACTH